MLYESITYVFNCRALVVGIDIVIGPALTLVVAQPTKPRAELIRDLIVIAVLQLTRGSMA